MTSFTRSAKIVLAFVFFVALLGVFSDRAHAQSTIRPNDGQIEYIEFVHDGLQIKLTTKGWKSGIDYGSTLLGSRDLAKRVKSATEKRFKYCSKISISKLALEIQKHAVAYSLFIKRSRANPVNVEYREII